MLLQIPPFMGKEAEPPVSSSFEIIVHAPHAPHSTRDAWGNVRLNGKETLRLFPGRTCARALFGPSPTTLGTVCSPGPGAPVGVLE
jgi:hypothetical protein